MRDEPVPMTLGHLKRRLEELSMEHGDDTVVVVPNMVPDSTFYQPKQVEAVTVVNYPLDFINRFEWERIVPDGQPHGQKLKTIVLH